jgi:hypothetical protein
MGMLFMLLMLLVLLSVTALEVLMSYETLLFSPLAEHQSTVAIYDQKIYSDLYVQLNVMTLCMMHNFCLAPKNSVYFLVSPTGQISPHTVSWLVRDMQNNQIAFSEVTPSSCTHF